ncbi:putative secreted protein [Roseibium sp. TrichSKD4]|uniref:DM13 domain-containing protein n=1 Tax=Roseibium sp. TrichSKD4 TaxID=744980 RepID=UPI0001E56F82|nr:DM13 domain-containing protein [Roseibium sp. TrichSKD4]EFO32235.1 putative secreted protein [Roseibium sp. TrichSKD4]
MKKLFLLAALIAAMAVQPALGHWVRPGSTESNRSSASESVRGSFKGANRYRTSGSVSIKDNGNTITVTLGRNFSFSGGPDPFIALANGTRKPIVVGGKLKRNKGGQTYRIKKPRGFKGASHVLIWCKRHSVTMGHARIR